MKEYQGLQLGFKNELIKPTISGNKDDINDLSEASKFLKNQVIGALVDKLDNLELIPIDSESLCSILHQHGINIRYLSHIASLCYIPHVREICATEMLARTIKNIMN